MEHIQKGKADELGNSETLEAIADKFYEKIKELKWDSKIRKRLDMRPRNRHFTNLRNWIQDDSNFRKLIISKPSELKTLMYCFGEISNERNPANKKKLSDSKQLLSIWGYESFRRNDAFEFYSEHLDVPICPYCNRNHTTTLHKGKNGGKLLFNFDHFFSKEEFPYLSMSFFNLIPSCAVCNTQMKGRQVFTIDENCHPFAHCFHDTVRFFVVPCASNAVGAHELDFAPTMESKPEDWKRAFGNVEAFELKELYRSHYDEIPRFKKLQELYPKEYMQSLADNNPKLFPCGIEDVKRTLLGASFIPGEISKRPLGKLINDLYEQLWK